MAVAANRFQLARTLDEDRAQLRAPLQSDVIQKQQHVVYADGLRTAGPGQTLRFNLPTDPGKFLDTIGSYFSFDLAITASSTLGGVVNSADTATCGAVPVNGIASMISMVRLTSRGQIIEEISEYGLIHSIVREMTTPRDEMASLGWIAGETSHAANTIIDKVTAVTSLYHNPVTATTTNSGIRKFCVKLDQLGFFASQHYIPLEFMPITIELTFHQVNKCMRTNGAALATNLALISYNITEPQFHAELLTFNAEYTGAVNSKIVTDGAIIPIKSYRHTAQFYGSQTAKMVLTMKVKSLVRLLVVPRFNHVVNLGGVGMDQYVSQWGTTATGAGLGLGSAVSGTAGEISSYRFLVGSSPVTDHSINCLLGGAQQAMEVVKYFRQLGDELNFGDVIRPSQSEAPVRTASGEGGWKNEYGIICQNFSLEKIESDDVFTGQFANSFSDLMFELDSTVALSDANKLILDFFLQYNAILTITPTALYIES